MRAAGDVWKNAALVVLGVALGLGGVEIALRTTGWVFLQLRQPVGRWASRGAADYRVLCLGESTTADMLLRGKQSYPVQLERILRQRSHGVRFTVINGGIPATTTDAIVELLPDRVARIHPDMIVTMMGINDGESSDPVFPVAGRFRVWKLARMLYSVLWRSRAAVTADGAGFPDMISLRGEIAGQRIIEGKSSEGEALLLSITQQDQWSIAKSRAHGMMAVSMWQRGDQEGAERYYQRFRELDRRIPRSRTTENYRWVQRFLADRGIPLVAVQYPGLPVDVLRQMLDPSLDVTVVDNEQTFLQAIKSRPSRDIYRDLFGGVFGHMTPYANGLLAENVAGPILSVVARSPSRAGPASPARPAPTSRSS